MSNAEEQLVKAAWVAHRLAMSVNTVYPHARKGIIPCVRLGGMVRFRPSDIERYIQEKAAQTQDALAAIQKT